MINKINLNQILTFKPARFERQLQFLVFARFWRLQLSIVHNPLTKLKRTINKEINKEKKRDKPQNGEDAKRQESQH
jgi:hypothetical protein